MPPRFYHHSQRSFGDMYYGQGYGCGYGCGYGRGYPYDSYYMNPYYGGNYGSYGSYSPAASSFYSAQLGLGLTPPALPYYYWQGGY